MKNLFADFGTVAGSTATNEVELRVAEQSANAALALARRVGLVGAYFR